MKNETTTRQNSTEPTSAEKPTDKPKGNERRIKIDVPFEEAVKRLLRVPPLGGDERVPS